MTSLSLDQANIIIGAAFDHAASEKMKPLGVVVVDAGGHLLAFQRQDGASVGRFQIASGKACGALFLGISSRKIADMAAERPAFVTAAAAGAPNGLIPAAGGVIIVDDAGHALGAVGVSGDLSDNDEDCALAGIAAAGLQPQP